MLFELHFRNSLQFQYEAVADAIRLKRLEVETMAKEFEMKMKLKEVCQSLFTLIFSRSAHLIYLIFMYFFIF